MSDTKVLDSTEAGIYLEVWQLEDGTFQWVHTDPWGTVLGTGNREADLETAELEGRFWARQRRTR